MQFPTGYMGQRNNQMIVVNCQNSRSDIRSTSFPYTGTNFSIFQDCTVCSIQESLKDTLGVAVAEEVPEKNEISIQPSMWLYTWF